MCGIAGLIHRGKSGAIGQEMTAMLEALKHRGPDSTGFALYGEPQKDELIMRLKLAEQEETRKGFDIHKKLPERRQEVDRRHQRARRQGRRCGRRRPSTRTGIASIIAGDKRKLSDYIEDVEGVEILSLGSALELIKDLGIAPEVAEQYQSDGVQRHARHRTHADGDRIRRRHQVGASVLGVSVRRRVGGAQRPADELLDADGARWSGAGTASCPTATPS